jgi:hypothetical protein
MQSSFALLDSRLARQPQQRAGAYSLVDEQGLLAETVFSNNLKQDLTKLYEFMTPTTDTFKNNTSLILGADPDQIIENPFSHRDNLITGHFTKAVEKKSALLNRSLEGRPAVLRGFKGIYVQDAQTYNEYIERIKSALGLKRVPIQALPKLGKPGANLHFPEGGIQLNKDQALQHTSAIQRVINPILSGLA